MQLICDVQCANFRRDKRSAKIDEELGWWEHYGGPELNRRRGPECPLARDESATKSATAGLLRPMARKEEPPTV